MVEDEFAAKGSVATVEFLECAGFLCLTTHHSQSSFGALKLLANAYEINFGSLELPLRLNASKFELRNACRFLQNGAPLDGAGLQHGGDPSLFDDAVGSVPDAGVEEQVFDVFEPDLAVVDEILAAAVAVQPSSHLHLISIHGEPASALRDGCLVIDDWILESQGDRGHAKRLAAGRAGEDDIEHGPAP